VAVREEALKEQPLADESNSVEEAPLPESAPIKKITPVTGMRRMSPAQSVEVAGAGRHLHRSGRQENRAPFKKRSGYHSSRPATMAWPRWSGVRGGETCPTRQSNEHQAHVSAVE